jgi:hypothetical protein
MRYPYIYILLFLLSTPYSAISQTFYVNSGYPGLRDNQTYKLNITPCDTFAGKDTLTMLIHTCPQHKIQHHHIKPCMMTSL